MCGVAGVLSLGRPLDEHDGEDARRMGGLLAHRGPDGRGLFQDARCALAHRRLKILDMSERGAQPMSNPAKTVWLSYNGEVTNFRELAARFRLDGLSSRSDTEVLLRLYERLGIDFVRHLNGMFAFCLYDVRSAKAYIVRDFFGLRPMFYMRKPGRLYCGSEIKSFLSLPTFSGRLDREALHHFFSLAYIPGRATPFEEIRELDSGHLLEVDMAAGTVSEREYYTLRYAPDAACAEQETARRVLDALQSSVHRSLDADAPIGLTLSGGVDTSTILALAREQAPDRELHTFSIRMDEASFDETRYQRIMTDFARPIHHEVLVTPAKVLEQLVRHVAFLDEPNGDGAAIPMFLLAQEARRHVKGLVSGEGGDEVFNAYETHRAYRAREFYRNWTPLPLRRALAAAAEALPVSHRKLSFDFVAKRFTRGAEMSPARAHFFWRHALSEEEKRELLPGGGPWIETAALFERAFDSLDFEDPLSRLSWIDMRYYFVGDLLVKNDRMTMAHGVESRYPFMDRELVELASRIPTTLKIRGLEGRYIHKLAMKGRLPDKIWRRKNMGLEMPHSLWFLGPLRKTAEHYFSKRNIEKTGILSHAAVDALWRQHLSGARDNGRPLWCILIFLIWFDLFVYDRNYRQYL